MATRKHEKIERANTKLKSVKQIARMRMLGQRIKDDGAYYPHEKSSDYTRREKKQIKKLENIIRK